MTEKSDPRNTPETSMAMHAEILGGRWDGLPLSFPQNTVPPICFIVESTELDRRAGHPESKPKRSVMLEKRHDLSAESGDSTCTILYKESTPRCPR
jgi:hypothetical protein